MTAISTASGRQVDIPDGSGAFGPNVLQQSIEPLPCGSLDTHGGAGTCRGIGTGAISVWTTSMPRWLVVYRRGCRGARQWFNLHTLLNSPTFSLCVVDDSQKDKIFFSLYTVCGIRSNGRRTFRSRRPTATR